MSGTWFNDVTLEANTDDFFFSPPRLGWVELTTIDGIAQFRSFTKTNIEDLFNTRRLTRYFWRKNVNYMTLEYEEKKKSSFHTRRIGEFQYRNIGKKRSYRPITNN